MKSSVIRSRQAYRGLTEILKCIGVFNQAMHDIAVCESQLNEIRENQNTFLKSYIGAAAKVPPIGIYTGSTDGVLEMEPLPFRPLYSQTSESMNGTINEIQYILKYCKDKIGDYDENN